WPRDWSSDVCSSDLCDTSGHCGQTGSLLFRNSLEGVQNAHHRAEQPDEGSGRADGCQSAQAAFQLGVNDGFGALQSALGSFNGFARNFAALLVSAEFHQAGGDHLGQMALLVALGDPDGFINLAIA